MKKYLRIYLKFTLFILIAFTVVSLILASIISFIHLSNGFYYGLVNFIAGFIMVLWSIWLVKLFNSKAIYHAFLCALLFSLVAVSININDINIIALLFRPAILIISTIIFSMYQKKLEK